MNPPRQFLVCGVLAGLVLAGGGLVTPAQQGDIVSDGSQSRGMITRAAQEAIDMGLAYLAHNQNPDGSFGTNQYRGNVALTSLSALAFMAGGHQPGRGKYGNNVTRALQAVLASEQITQRPGFLSNHHQGPGGPMYGHGFGTLFLAEVHGMIPNRDLRERTRAALERAVDVIIKSQNGAGGWRYQPEPKDADISVTICQIMALRAARNAGISVPKSVADKCTQYVRTCQVLRGEGEGGFKYMPQGGPPGFARTAAGIVALYSAGIYKDASVEKGLEYLRRNCMPGTGLPVGPRRDFQMHYYYGHYYAVQAMWTAGGRYWTEWYPAIRDELVNHSDRDRSDGSWYDRRICPHYCTAMACIVLQVPNNYLPILQR